LAKAEFDGRSPHLRLQVQNYAAHGMAGSFFKNKILKEKV
jgi:hypothetical protein